MECVICYETNTDTNPLMIISCCCKFVHDECLLAGNIDKCMICRSPLFVTLPISHAQDVDKVRKFELSLPDLRSKLDSQFKIRLDMFVNAVRHVSPVYLFEYEYILGSMISFSDVNCTIGKEKNTLMHYAACVSYKMIVELLKRGANVNYKNLLHSTPLVYALTTKKWELADKLLQHGATVYNKILYTAVNNDVPTYMLRILLLKVKHLQTLYFSRTDTIIHCLIQKQKLELLTAVIDVPMIKSLLLIHGSLLFICAIKYGSNLAIPILLNAGVNVNSAVLNFALLNSTHSDALKLMFANVTTIQTLYISDRHNTVLHCVIRKGNAEIANMALNNAAFRSLIEDKEENYLEYAILQSNLAVAKVLLEFGCKRIGNRLEVADKIYALKTIDPNFVDMLCCSASMFFNLFENICSCVSDKYKCALFLLQEPGRVNSTSIIKKLQALDLDFNFRFECGRSLEAFTANKRVRDFILSKKTIQ